MKNIVKVGIFSLIFLVLFGCKQGNESKGGKEEKTFKIMFENPEFGTLSAKKRDGSPFTSGEKAKENEELTFTVVPNKDYVVETWKVARQDGKDPNVAHLIVTEEATVSVKLKGKGYKVIYKVEGGHGSLSAIRDGKPVNNGAIVDGGSVVFQASPDDGYKVKEWQLQGGIKTLGGNPGDVSMTVQLNSDVDVKVIFEINKHTVAFAVEGNGGKLKAEIDSVPINSDAVVDHNSIVVFVATPSDEQHEVDVWTYQGGVKVSGGTNGAKSLSIKVIENITVKVTFKEKNTGYKVSFAVDGNGGKITAQLEGVATPTETSPIEHVQSGKVIKFTAIADDGFKVKEWTGEGLEIEEENTKASLTVTSNVDVKVSFEAKALKWKIENNVLLGYEGDKPEGDITLPETIVEIANDALNGCIAITKITCPASLKKIGSGAFANCTTLEEIIFSPESTIEEVQAAAFAKCVALKKFHIPKTLITIDGRAFGGCTSLTEVTVDSEHPTFTSEAGIIYNKQKTKIVFVSAGIEIANIAGTVELVPRSAFLDLKKLKKVTIPASCKEIKQYAFSGCSSLETVILPNELEYVYDSAFSECIKLEKIELGTELEGISIQAFEGCSALKEVIIKSEYVGKIGKFAFKGIKENAKFKVKKTTNGKIKKALLNCDSGISETQIEEVDSF